MNRLIPKSEFSKNVATMLKGNIIAQILPLLATPILSRIFSVEEFGLFAFYSSLVSFFLVIAAGRYEMAILLPKEDKEAINLMTLSFTIVSILSLLLLIVVVLFENQLLNWLDKPQLSGWLIMVPIAVFIGTSYRILTYWSNRRKRFKGTSISSVTQSISRMLVNLFGGLLKTNFYEFKVSIITFFKVLFSKNYVLPIGYTQPGMGSLIYGYIVGFGLGSFNLSRSFFKYDRELLKDVTIKDIKRLAKLHDKFPKINAVHALVDEIKNSGVTFVISYLFSEIVLGLYSMTFRVLTLPLSIIGNAFGQVFLQKAAEMYANEQSLEVLIKTTLKKLSYIALPIFLPIILFGPQLFSFVLGDDYSVSGEYAQLLTPWLFLNFIMSPVLQIAVIMGKQKEIFRIALVGNLIIFGSIFFGGYFFESLTIGFIILSVLEIGYYAWLYKWIFKLAVNTNKNNTHNE